MKDTTPETDSPSLPEQPQDGSALFIVDNSDADWKVAQYVHEWCSLAQSMDIATGFFEIGGLLALKDDWQKVDHIRILMGDEVSFRTKAAFVKGLSAARERLDASLEAEKESNDFLSGVSAIAGAIRSRKIECRIYRKDKFHAKAYITHARARVVGSAALVGSSNFTYPGLTQNVELNVQITGAQVTTLQEWFERHWELAEDVTLDMLRTIDRHVQEYTPFEVYARALQEFFRGHEMTPDEWETLNPEMGGSRMLPVLDDYQRDGYRALVKIARQHGGALLCDGVGLGKTFIGLMLIERLVVHERKNVVLLVPKSARKPVWESAIRRYLPHLGGDFSGLAIFNHTDLQRQGEDLPSRFERIKERADVFVIDEAHHFRNKGIAGRGDRRPSRYRQLYDLLDGPRGPKQLFMLTATPINNKLIDLQHMIELFARDRSDHFKSTLGINSLQGHFRTLEKQLKLAAGSKGKEASAPDIDTNMAGVEQILSADPLFEAIVVQRSRAYVKQSQLQAGGSVAMFPERETPKVAEYSAKKTYGRLLEMVDRAFAKQKPLFSLAMYYPLFYYKGNNSEIDPLAEGRQEQIVGLIRVQFLKRFESSVHAFGSSCERLLMRLLAFVTKHSETQAEMKQLERWRNQHAELIDYVREHQTDLFEESEEEEDVISEELLETVEYLDRSEYKVEEIIAESMLDLNQVAEFLNEARKFKPRNDDKLKALVKLLKTDKVMSSGKVLIFSEYAETARYLKDQMTESEITGVDQIDSGDGRDRGQIIRAFAPYYNGSSSAQLANEDVKEIRILISTDVLSEGLNLQDATRLINYDLHWNPVRLMQRIGRVDRRMSPEVEDRLLSDHPEQAPLRGKVAYWNFLPPDELEDLLNLYSKVAHKTLRISRTLGIEGRKLLRPEDDYEALRDLNARLDSQTTPIEALRLQFRQMLLDDPELEDRLKSLPGRVYSGKEHPTPGTRAVFFCYALPAAERGVSVSTSGQLDMLPIFSEEAGKCAWYLYELAADKIHEDATIIAEVIHCEPPTPRHCAIEQKTLAEIRRTVEKHIKNSYLKKIQAPLGVGPILKCWMEIN